MNTIRTNIHAIPLFGFSFVCFSEEIRREQQLNVHLQGVFDWFGWKARGYEPAWFFTEFFIFIIDCFTTMSPKVQACWNCWIFKDISSIVFLGLSRPSTCIRLQVRLFSPIFCTYAFLLFMSMNVYLYIFNREWWNNSLSIGFHHDRRCNWS